MLRTRLRTRLRVTGASEERVTCRWTTVVTSQTTRAMQVFTLRTFERSIGEPYASCGFSSCRRFAGSTTQNTANRIRDTMSRPRVLVTMHGRSIDLSSLDLQLQLGCTFQPYQYTIRQIPNINTARTIEQIFLASSTTPHRLWFQRNAIFVPSLELPHRIG